MENDSTKISIVVCTYNRSNLLPACLDSLRQQNIGDESYEIIVIDNNSTDNTVNIANDYVKLSQNMRLICEPRQGLGFARNRGWREAYGQYIAFIDDDAIADKEWIKNILAAFEYVKPTPAVVGGIITPYYVSKKPEWFLDAYELRSFGENPVFLEEDEALEGFSGSNMAIPKKVLQDYGGFEADMGMKGKRLRVGEETAFFNKVYFHLPYFWYDPEIKVKHLVPIKNMRVRYRLKRVFTAGLSKRRTHGDSASLMNIAVIFRRILYESIISLFKINWREKYWQRLLLEYLTPIFYLLGWLTDNTYELCRSYLSRDLRV